MSLQWAGRELFFAHIEDRHIHKAGFSYGPKMTQVHYLHVYLKGHLELLLDSDLPANKTQNPFRATVRIQQGNMTR